MAKWKNFDNSKNKIEKIWGKNSQNNNNLINKDNSKELSYFSKISKKSINKSIIELYDSGYFLATNTALQDASIVSLDENGNHITLTVNKNTQIPFASIYNKSIELPISEHFLPFIKIATNIKKIPDYNLSSGGKFVSSQFTGTNDIVEIKGDGNLLYSGSPQKINYSNPLTNTILSVFTEDELTEYSIPIDNTKRVYKATVNYTRGGKIYRISGILTRIIATYDMGASCSVDNDSDVYDALVFEEYTGIERYDNEFLDLTETSFSIKTQKQEKRHVDIPPCTYQNTVTEGVTFNSQFSLTDSYLLQIIGKHTNITDEINLGDNQKVTINSATDTINSKTFELIGYRVYYNNLKQGIVSIKNTGESDGNFLDEIEIYENNLPNTDDGHTLSYTTINFQRNFDTFDREIYREDKYIQHTRNDSKVFLKKHNGNFFITLSGTYLLTSPAIKEFYNSRQFPKYNDNYTISGNTYAISTQEHSFLETPVYIPEVIDTQVRLKIVLQNPLYWKEDKKHDV